MKTVSATILFLLVPAIAFAATPERPILVDGDHCLIHGGNPAASATASRDTVYLIGPWGSGALVNGQFESPEGAPAWNGWTSLDYTQKTESHWHADVYHAVSGEYSAWCGEIGYASCDETDPEGGYGSSYDEWLSWIRPVGNPDAPTTVEISALVNHDVEPGYDYCHLGYWKAGDDIAYLWTVDGKADQVPVSASVTYEPGEYAGDSGDQVHLTWQVTSDGGWDDGDCSYPSSGAMQLDDVTVTMTNDGVETTTFDDFEDGTLGENWAVEMPPGVGDYAHIRAMLGDVDPCGVNLSPQVCFIADEIMERERGLPSQECIDWCYGPHGYIVNTRGGQAGPEAHLHAVVLSPVVAWPGDDYGNVSVEMDVYRHEDLSANAPGMFYSWHVRMTDSENPADIDDGGYFDGEFVYYGGPDYIRLRYIDWGWALEPGVKFVRAALEVYELGYVWGWEGNDGYPAPYFDNVALKAYQYEGPTYYARELDLAQDAFPADGQIHTGADLGLNDVRFDMARDISLWADLRNDPGDSVVVEIGVLRAGSTLVETDLDGTVTAPRLHFTLRMNPLFGAALRVGAGPYTVNAGTDGELHGEITGDGAVGGRMTGWVAGALAMAAGQESPGRWMFDLPDEDFLYPGDVLHWYIVAWENAGGEYRDAYLPADRTSYGDFDDPLGYDPGCVVHALPTLQAADGSQPDILFWNDFGNRGGRDKWYGAFGQLGLYPGEHFDVYYTNGPSSGVGNGLGGRAAYGQIDGYGTILYTCGDLGWGTISNLDYENDPGDDVGLMNHWLEQGGKHLFACGDDLVTDLWVNGGSTTQAFVSSWMGLAWEDASVRPLLGGDIAPIVTPVADNPVFQTTDSWIAYGGCRTFNTFDAITVTGGETLAEFNDGTSGLSAATRTIAPNGSTVLSLPYDLMFVRTTRDAAKAGQPASLPARAQLLSEVLLSFGVPPTTGHSGTGTPAAAFTVGAYPNPFNPVVKIACEMPRAGRLTVKIYNLRGERVRTLVDEMRPAGSHFVTWDGADDRGRAAASGAYFYEARTGSEVRTDKLLLVK